MKPIHSTRRRILHRRNLIIIAALAVTFIIMAICISALDAGAGSCPEDTVVTSYPAPLTVQSTESIPNPVNIPEESTEIAPEWKPDPEDVEAIAKTLYGECRGVKSKAEQAAVAWCILNRVDSSRYPDTVIEVITQPHQFSGYDEDYPVWDELEELAVDVLTRWHSEREGGINVGRTLPHEYVFFTGDGYRNHFTIEWRGKSYWNWSLESPYES